MYALNKADSYRIFFQIQTSSFATVSFNCPKTVRNISSTLKLTVNNFQHGAKPKRK